MLSRLIYASEVATPLSPELLQDLLVKARRDNRLRDLTGLMVFNNRYFLQVLEGERQQVSDLYARLVHDVRHRRLVLLGFEAVGERLFTDWSMGFAPADALRRGDYLRYSASSQFNPTTMSASAALALLVEWGRQVSAEPKEQGEPQTTAA